MTKNLLFLSVLLGGITLCVFKSAAFIALGVIIGLLCAVCGISLICGVIFPRTYSPALAIVMIALGILMVILCIFFEAAAFFVGGVALFCAGVLLIPICHAFMRIIAPLCGGFIIMGLLIVVAPSLAGVMSVVLGILLIFYSLFIALYFEKLQ